MFRIGVMFLVLLVFPLGCKTHMGAVYSDLRTSEQVLTGALTISSSMPVKNWNEACQKRILHKYLYEGFENTAFWRPQELKKEVKDDAFANELMHNIYITELDQQKRKNCRCKFQLNVAATRKMLENEGYIPAFGY